MKKVYAILLMLIVILGCQNSSTERSKNALSIKVNDVKKIEIRNEEESYTIVNSQDKVDFINVINNSEYNQAQLDIRPSDYAVEIWLLNEEIIKFSLWIIDGGTLFAEHSVRGYYKFTENDRLRMLEIINNAEGKPTTSSN